MHRLETDEERFVQATIRIDENETMGKTLYERAVEEGRVKGKAEGEANGLAEGEAKGKADVLLRLLRRRFGAMDPALEAKVRAADTDELDRWTERILDAKTVAEVFG